MIFFIVVHGSNILVGRGLMTPKGEEAQVPKVDSGCLQPSHIFCRSMRSPVTPYEFEHTAS